MLFHKYAIANGQTQCNHSATKKIKNGKIQSNSFVFSLKLYVINYVIAFSNYLCGYSGLLEVPVR